MIFQIQAGDMAVFIDKAYEVGGQCFVDSKFVDGVIRQLMPLECGNRSGGQEAMRS